MDRRKFISKFTKEEIIEAFFQEAPECDISNVAYRMFENKSDRLLRDIDLLAEQLEQAGKSSDNAKFMLIMRKLKKKQKESDSLDRDYKKVVFRNTAH